MKLQKTKKPYLTRLMMVLTLLSGLKLEDMRRFGRANAERKRNFFPYPFKERDGNSNTPADPTF
jgi:hypothetical protein